MIAIYDNYYVESYVRIWWLPLTSVGWDQTASCNQVIPDEDWMICSFQTLEKSSLLTGNTGTILKYDSIMGKERKKFFPIILIIVFYILLEVQ